MTSLLKLSNLLLSQIISSIDDNEDIICLLFTCKKLYNNSSSIRRSIGFKGIEAINENVKEYISRKFIVTATLKGFNLNSFKDVLVNGISNHQVILGKYANKDIPQWIQQRISLTDRDRDDMKSGITTALVNNATPTLIESLYDDTPSLETLFIDDKQTVVDLDRISLLPRLKQLEVRANQLIIGQHTSLKSLKIDVRCDPIDMCLTKFVSLTELTYVNSFVHDRIGPGLLPNTLTSLTLTLMDAPPQDTFLPLTSLAKLKIDFQKISMEDVEVDDQPIIDLQSLSRFEKLSFSHPFKRIRYNLVFRVPPSIKSLGFFSTGAKIARDCPMPLLEKLFVAQNTLIDGRVSLMTSSTSLKELCIYECNGTFPAAAGNSNDTFIIPSSLEKLTIFKQESKVDVLQHLVLPPSLTDLTIMDLPSSYPPNLETLNLLDIKGDFMIDVPSTVKYLLMRLAIPPKPWQNDILVFSITSGLTKSINSVGNQSQWLPINTTHLTCNLNTFVTHIAFRLDQVINHTNVRYLNINISSINYQFSIQRLDLDNNNVLILERQTLQGGIITQKRTKSINNQKQQQQQYDPIYLLCEVILKEKKTQSYIIKIKDFPQWIQLADSGITTALVNDFKPSLIKSISEIPSIETLFINQEGTMDLSFISLLPRLQRLAVSADKRLVYLHHTTLDFNSKSAYISTRSTLPKLEKLGVSQVELFNSLLVSPLLKKLVIYNCNEIIPENKIPKTVEKLTIFKLVYKDILGQVIVWKPDVPIKDIYIKFPPSYPPTLETLDLIDIKGEYTIDNIPPSTKHFAYIHSPTVFKDLIKNGLSSNTTHLTCLVDSDQHGTKFRLDEIINQTNVRYLNIILVVIDYSTREYPEITRQTHQFTIQRLDSDNLNVLVLETQSLIGGFITQRQRNVMKPKSNQQKQKYDPFYLCFNIGCDSNEIYNYKILLNFQKKQIKREKTKTTIN
ncbi:hypothetical protein DFA_08444 [Cavenderia fasciculata]|uniref:Uncharacterized protein n=1 Tax=Cavenderia fasciculata TaxID=261658 RepID=F4Q675_CACFS|nr:uncharacterized protein DFA_08444 [Cavenderia fasciculata]EGG17449.1 hypothetical protein DFA_08444 [Cavenderia fasciculata]|eukprot:XP_004355933.1 hypothetical protein DFA_08444 [Cavenderia fasciculata]